MRGKVKWFDNRRGFGFIETSKDEDIFIHYQSIDIQGYKTLKKGDYVEYEVLETPKGLQAKHIKPIKEYETIY